MPTEEQWVSILSGEKSEEETEAALKEAGEKVQIGLEERPDALADVLAILGKRLEQVVPETWTDVMAALTQYLGMDASFLVTWVVQAPVRLDEFGQMLPADVTSFLRTVLAWFQPELDAAYAGWREFPDDWRWFSREVFIEPILGRTRVRVKLIKYNGEEVVFEGSPNSFLNLGRNLLNALAAVGTKEAFDPRGVSSFFEDTKEFFELLGESDEVKEAFDESPPTSST